MRFEPEDGWPVRKDNRSAIGEGGDDYIEVWDAEEYTGDGETITLPTITVCFRHLGHEYSEDLTPNGARQLAYALNIHADVFGERDVPNSPLDLHIEWLKQRLSQTEHTYSRLNLNGTRERMCALQEALQAAESTRNAFNQALLQAEDRTASDENDDEWDIYVPSGGGYRRGEFPGLDDLLDGLR